MIEKAGIGIDVDITSRLFLVESEVSGNTAELNAGGLYLDPDTVVAVTGSRIFGNTAGFDGGGFVAYGDLSLIRSEVTDNTALMWSGGAISTGGSGSFSTSLSLVESTISDNTAGNAGGAILFCNGDFEMVRSTVSGNTAGTVDGLIPVGGGIALCGATATIENSTLSGNQVFGTAGSHPGEGGAIALVAFGAVDVNLTITDSTIADNAATQGGQAITTWDSGNGGGAEARIGNTIIDDTLLADNCRTGGSSSIVSDDYNLSSDLTCGLQEANDFENTSAILAPLGDHGGPTLTHELQDASPAIDTGTLVDGPATDQRGYPRPFGGQCDRGSVETGHVYHIFQDGFESGNTSAWSSSVQ